MGSKATITVTPYTDDRLYTYFINEMTRFSRMLSCSVVDDLACI